MAKGTPDHQGTIGQLKATLNALRNVINPIFWMQNNADTQNATVDFKRVYTITAKGSIIMLYVRINVTSSAQNEENWTIKIETDSNIKLHKRLTTMFNAGDYKKDNRSPFLLHTYDTANKIYEFTIFLPFTFDTEFKLTIFGLALNNDTFTIQVITIFNADGSYTTDNTLTQGIFGASDEGTEDESGTGETFDL